MTRKGPFKRLEKIRGIYPTGTARPPKKLLTASEQQSYFQNQSSNVCNDGLLTQAQESINLIRHVRDRNFSAKLYTLKIKQTPLSNILEPRIWGLGSFSLKKHKVSQFVNGDHARTPKCTEG
jgi:hypothetical protein